MNDSIAPTIPIHKIIISDRIRTDSEEHREFIENELAPSIEAHGLIQPIVLHKREDGEMELIAGWSRVQAHLLLGRQEIAYTFRENLSEVERIAIEAEENMRRRGMTWYDECLAIYKVHNLHVALENRKIGTDEFVAFWTQAATGKLLGISRASVTNALQVAKELLSGDEELFNAPNFDAARRILLERAQKKAEQELARRQKDSISLRAPTLTTLPQSQPSAIDLILSEGLVAAEGKLPSTKERLTIDLSSLLINAESVSVKNPESGYLNKLKPESLDFIITDIPYGIDTDNFVISAIKMVTDEHDAEENIQQMPLFLKAAFRALKEETYCIFFYALDHHEKLVNWATEAGFTVQKHPLIWIKTSSSQNTSAFTWWTKNVEFAMVLRKGKATLKKPVIASTFAYSSDAAKKQFGHPFSKPVELVNEILSAFVTPGMVGCDPYAGRGSVAAAGIQLGCRMLCVEKQEEHFVALQENIKTIYRRIFPDKEVVFK